ncbi:MAG: DUF2330 domain-containing protein [bacterium]|nr:DUF2330 domain-containing protein [bacterium]
MKRFWTRAAGAAIALFLGLPVMAAPARACGGFFCSRQPIDQSGEKILFIRDEQSLTAIVQIQYQGAAENFSWVVPVPARPTVTTSSDELFTRLEPATQVQVRLTASRTEGTCRVQGGMFDSRATGLAAPAMAELARNGVNVVEQGLVGPFEKTILTAESAEALRAWLNENQYVLPPRFDEVVKGYLKPGYHFVALKLRQDRGVGDLVPVVLRYDTGLPCIPLVLTSIAARDDMPITAYVLGKGRAVPTNYRHVRINEARLDWFNGGSNYNQLVTEAVNEAGGKAFVTDCATRSADLASVVRPTYDLTQFRGLATLGGIARELDRQGFPAGSLRAGTLGAVLTRRSVVFTGNLETMLANSADPALDRIRIDDTTLQEMIDALEEVYLRPLREAHQAFSKDYTLTRFYTTMSPAEMTEDPDLDFNDQLPFVSNVHSAEAVTLCDPSLTFEQAPVEIRTASGLRFAVRRGQVLNDPALPASSLIEELNTLDLGKVLSDQAPAIQAWLGKHANSASVLSAIRAAAGTSGCSCFGTPRVARDFHDGAGEATVVGLVGFGTWARTRRRSRRRRP